MQLLSPVAIPVDGSGNPQTFAISLPASNRPAAVKLSNESPWALGIRMSGLADWLDPGTANVWPVPSDAFEIDFTPYVVIPGAPAPGSPVVLPVLAFPGESFPGNYPANVTPSQPVVQLQAVSDARTFAGIVNHRREQIVARDDSRYSSVQVGRYLMTDDMENPAPQWTQSAGTIASDTTVAKRGTRSLKLTTAAGAGATAIARKFYELPADQFVSTFPQLCVEVWFKPLDINWRDIQVWCRPDDSTQKWQAAMRVRSAQTGSGDGAQNRFQYLDQNGTFQNLTTPALSTYPLTAAGGNVGDPWHHVLMALNYLQGTGGYLTYALLKLDDFTVRPGAPSAQKLATSGVREGSCDLLITCDGATATTIHFDEALVADLSNTFEL